MINLKSEDKVWLRKFRNIVSIYRILVIVIVEIVTTIIKVHTWIILISLLTVIRIIKSSLHSKWLRVNIWTKFIIGAKLVIELVSLRRHQIRVCLLGILETVTQGYITSTLETSIICILRLNMMIMTVVLMMMVVIVVIYIICIVGWHTLVIICFNCFHMTIISTLSFFRILSMTLNTIITILYSNNYIQLTSNFINSLHYSTSWIVVNFTISPLTQNLLFFLSNIM